MSNEFVMSTLQIIFDGSDTRGPISHPKPNRNVVPRPDSHYEEYAWKQESPKAKNIPYS